jgi:hypothetical protein
MKKTTQAQKEASSATPVQRSCRMTIRDLVDNLRRRKEINGNEIRRRMKLEKSLRIKNWKKKSDKAKRSKKMKMQQEPTKRLTLRMRMTTMTTANQSTRHSWM